mgnify:FL=1|jgi:deoxycytidylate deaminase
MASVISVPVSAIAPPLQPRLIITDIVGTSASPCYDCFKLIANAGINKIYFGEFYRDEQIMEHAKKLGIDLVDLSK